MSALLEAARAVSAVWAGPTPVEQYLERMTLAINVLRAAIEAESAYVPMTDDELMDAAIVGRRAWEEAGKPEGLLVPMQRRAIEQATAARLGGVPP